MRVKSNLDGSWDGRLVGCRVGWCVGWLEGSCDGRLVGCCVGWRVGCDDGTLDGWADGCLKDHKTSVRLGEGSHIKGRIKWGMTIKVKPGWFVTRTSGRLTSRLMCWLSCRFPCRLMRGLIGRFHGWSRSWLSGRLSCWQKSKTRKWRIIIERGGRQEVQKE